MRAETPLLSVILPVYEVEAALLEEAIESVLHQSYRHWELCIADDASSKGHIREILDRYTAQDSRIRVTYREKRGHIAAASNTALALARGEFVVLLDHDDRLTPDALEEIARVVVQHREVDFVYSDEDKLELDGRRVEPFFKPAWSPTLLTSCNYITHLAALRRSLVLEVGGFRDEAVGSQDFDLFLRVAERARAVAHIPLVLYSWRKIPASAATASSAKPYAVEAARRALEQTIERRGLPSRVEPAHLNGIFLVRHSVPLPVRVSLVINGQGTAWTAALQSVGVDVCDIAWVDGMAEVDYPRESHMPPIVGRIDDLSGDYLIWLDAASWPSDEQNLLRLLEPLQTSGVAVAGGMTRHRGSGSVVQAGIAIEPGGQPAYCYQHLPTLAQPNFYLNLKDLPREVSAVSVACCTMRRETWHAMDGWRHDLPAALAMCDLCLRALDRGQSSIYTPLAQMQVRRDLPPLPPVADHDWPWTRFADPFWNPNLNIRSGDGLPFRWEGERDARVQPGAAARVNVGDV